MSRAENRRRARDTKSRGAGPRQGRRPWWILLASAGAAVLVLAAISQAGRADTHHPSPRLAEMASDVEPDAQAVDMAAALEAAGVQHGFVHYTDRGHMSVTDEVTEHTLAFMAEVERRR